ncbi:MAG TPA: paraquat-inducible protein A [Steroidobacteraceae bacterium]|jgi:paraquat-inducible protein A|nr:paraquat-inducible protein A [Steroidobacteraceae bacterium]
MMMGALHFERAVTPGAGSQRHFVECRNCGLLQIQPAVQRRDVVSCSRCNTQLEHNAGKSLDATLACSAAIMLLLVPAWTAPFLTASALGATRTSFLPMSVTVVWRDGSPLLAAMVCLFVLAFPLMRFGALTAVLLAMRLGRRPAWLTPAFRLCNALQVWAMLDVFLLGLIVAYFRLRSSLLVSLEPGAICFVLAGLLSLVARATLDKAQVWRSIGPDSTSIRAPSMRCSVCDLVIPRGDEPQTCPRCHARVMARKSNPYSRCVALLLAAGLMYLPANIYPIATIPINLSPTSYTVLGGVIDLVRSHLLALAALVFTASFTIPLLKMLGLAWCASSALCGSCRFLVGKTRVFRVVEEIGRWSMVDPLTIACFVPVLQFNALIDGHAEPAVVPFSVVVMLTTLAAQFFDPRSMWDAAVRNR